MSKLTKTQIEFKKQMEIIEKNKNYKNVIDDHNRFYHNKAYEIEIESNNKNKYKNIRRIIYIVLFIYIASSIYEFFEDFPIYIDAYKKENIIENNNNKNLDLNINYIYTDNDKKQYVVGIYNKVYREYIKSLSAITNSLINDYTMTNLDIEELNKELIVIDKLIEIFRNYEPEEINKELHKINIITLNNYKEIYKNTIIQNNDITNLEASENFINSFLNLNFNEQKYREELIKIFKEINMSYAIDENNKLTFTYKELNLN